MNKAVGKGEGEQNQAFKRFVNQFGTHYVMQADLGAKIHYERRFTKKSNSVTTINHRKDCVGKAAQSCTGGNFGILFLSANLEACPSKDRMQCTVGLYIHQFIYNIFYI